MGSTSAAAGRVERVARLARTGPVGGTACQGLGLGLGLGLRQR